MSMNFVTFNQDHSHLAVGEYTLLSLVGFLLNVAIRNLERFPDLHH